MDPSDGMFGQFDLAALLRVATSCFIHNMNGQ